MVNFGLNSASILGIFLAVAGAGLYFLRSVRPELSRDHDIFFAAVGLLCGLILLFQGWRLDPILQFGQFLLTGSAVFFAVETIRLRGATVEQARRNSGNSIVEDRPVSNVYRAELETLEAYEDEDYEPRGRLRGYQDPRSPRSSGYEETDPRTARSRRPSDSYGNREEPRPRRSRPSPATYDEWGEPPASWEERPSERRPRRPRTDLDSPASRTTKKRRPRPPQEPTTRREAKPSRGEYVDYQPLDEVDTGSSQWDRESTPKKPSSPSSDDYSREQPQNSPSPEDYNQDKPIRFDY